MAIEKQNGDIIEFVKQKDYIMVNNDLGRIIWQNRCFERSVY